ncbi:MAG: M15 family metallopeptidase [Labedaea sp.]
MFGRPLAPPLSALLTQLLVAVLTGLAACSAPPPATPGPTPVAPGGARPTSQPGTSAGTSGGTSPTAQATPAAPPAPVWRVGATPLPLRPDGFGQILPTPPVLADRHLPSADLLPPPAGSRYASTVAPVPPAVLARSTWRPGCPVTAAELRYLTMSFWGFDGRPHTGEMIVNARFANAVTTVFGTLFQARFPIEEMRVTGPAELDAPPTGDGNNTTAFVCRAAVTLTQWSAHASGLAVDVNPFCNPYVKGSLVLPELASSYVDRRKVRPGMVFARDATVRAFASIGWSWGGDWTSPKDLQHFTATGH